MAGLDGIAFPADGVVGVARAVGRPFHQEHACCSIKLGAPREPLQPTEPAPLERVANLRGETEMSCIKQDAQPDHGLPGTDRSFNAFDGMQPRRPAATPAEARNGRRVKESAVPPQGVYLPNNNVLDAADALARVRADVQCRGDHARHHAGQDAPLRLHALPEPAAHLPGRLPRQLRLLRPRPAPRGGARLRRPQFHPRRLAGRADAAGRRHRGAGWRADPVPPHVHLDDHAPAFGCGHGRGAEGMDRAGSTRRRSRCRSCRTRRRWSGPTCSG